MSMTPGATIGPYRIVEQTGRGGMATVYKAYQPALARYVAVKVLPAFFAEEDGFRQRFQQEAIAVARLRHPNILVVFDYGEENGIPYLVGDYIDGGTLAEQVGTPLPLDYSMGILAPIASALDYAHTRGILHRDVKPSNVLLQRDGTPILADFGLAKMMGSLSRLTGTGVAMGTPEYMAPEQAAGEAVDAGADNYALAVVAYELLTGRVPFSADTPLAVLLAHLHKPLPLPRTVNPALPAAVEDVLLKGLAKNPAERYPTASAFIQALSSAGQPAAPAPARAEPLPSALPAPPAATTGAPLLPAVAALPAARGPVARHGRHRVATRPALIGAGVLLALCIGLGLVVAPRLQSGQGGPALRATEPVAHVGWRAGAALPVQLSHQQAVALADGTVLVAGGYDAQATTTGRAELYDPDHDTWTSVAPLRVPRQDFVAMALPDGRVLVAGGQDNNQRVFASVEIYDPRMRTWRGASSMHVARSGATATRLHSGDVLVVGGEDDKYTPLASAEIYHPGTGVWTLAQAMPTAHVQHTATLLADGRVLVAGSGETDLFDPQTGRWTVAAVMLSSRDDATATLLPSGKVLLAGGVDYARHNTVLASAELYDPHTNRWTATTGMRIARYRQTATTLADGRVLVAGGAQLKGGADSALVSAEIYDPLSAAWAAAASMTEPRVLHTATRLRNGTVLVAGGAADSTDLFTPAH